MTNESDMEEILRLTDEVGARAWEGPAKDTVLLAVPSGHAAFMFWQEELSAFARKVRESEREACAALMDLFYKGAIDDADAAKRLEKECEHEGRARAYSHAADAIRSRTSP
jgi:hypothetical protein